MSVTDDFLADAGVKAQAQTKGQGAPDGDSFRDADGVLHINIRGLPDKGASLSDQFIADSGHVQSNTQKSVMADPSEGRLPFSPLGIDTGLTMPQGISRFMAGTGKAMTDAGRGLGNIATDVAPELAKYGIPTRSDTDASRKLDAPLMNTGAGIAGNIVGNIASYAPLAAIPGGATVAGGAGIGALTGAMQPLGAGDSRTNNAVGGAVMGAAIPATVNVLKALRAGLVDPFTSAGRNKIAGSLLNNSVADKEAVMNRLSTAQGNTPGFNPTVGQAAGDDGAAALYRATQAIDPSGFSGVEQGQRSALADALRNIAGTPEARSAQQELVDETAKKLYGQAFKENMPVTPELSNLARRPSMIQADARAQKLAEELSLGGRTHLADLNPRTIATDARMPQPSSVLADVEVQPARSISVPAAKPSPSIALAPAEKFNPYTNVAPKPQQQISIPSEFEVAGSRNVEIPAERGIRELPVPAQYEIAGSRSMEIPPLESVPVKDMHTLKMGMDALLKDQTLGIAGQEAKAITKTRNQFLDMFPESYQAARQAHIDLNRPIHQMDIGQELYNRFVPALADSDAPFKSTAAAYANALRNGDQMAKTVTGLKNAKLASIMTPEQMTTLQGVAKDSAMKAAAETAGRGVGSDSVQKIAMSNLANQAGIPNWVSKSGIGQTAGGWLKQAGGMLYSNPDKQIQMRLAEILRDPQAAAAAMRAAGASPSQITQALKLSAQGVALSAPASVDALQ